MCLIGARRRPCSELMLSRTRTRSRISASCITSRCHSTSERRCYGATEPGRYAPVPRPSRPADCRVLPIRVGGPTGSSTHQLNQGDLGGRAQPQRPPPLAPAPAHVQPHRDRKSTRLNSSHLLISYAVFCLKKKKNICQSFNET